MKERPIIFNTEMVRAVLNGRKTQTRRVIKPQPPQKWDISNPIENENTGIISWCFLSSQDKYDYGYKKCPYGKVGDRLWVREAYYNYDGEPLYKADMDKVQIEALRIMLTPSIFMPKKCSRITLEITDIRVERIQEISEDDSFAEGCEIGHGLDDSSPFFARGAFEKLWDSINAKRGYGWDTNPWVWVITFRNFRQTPKQLINFQPNTGRLKQFNNPDAPDVIKYKLKFWNDYLAKR